MGDPPSCPNCKSGVAPGGLVVHQGSCPTQGQPTREIRDAVQAVRNWWREDADTESAKLAPKAVEYGSYDLELIGKVLRDMIDSDHRVHPDLSNLELGIAFYELGKIARIVSGIFDGQVPSDDNWQDAAIYPRMVTYIREKGQWP